MSALGMSTSTACTGLRSERCNACYISISRKLVDGRVRARSEG